VGAHPVRPYEYSADYPPKRYRGADEREGHRREELLKLKALITVGDPKSAACPSPKAPTAA
jgi:hypothetical protein